MPNSYSLSFPLLIGALMVIGCQSGEKPIPVSSVVTLDGKPLVNVRVNLMAPNGAISFGLTDEQGRISNFTTISSGDGVIPGTYKASLAIDTPIAPDSGSANAYAVPNQKQHFPDKYRSADTSEIVVDIPSQGGEIPIVITSS